MSPSSSESPQLLGLLESLFGVADGELLRELPAVVEPVTVKAGETLFRQGDPAGAVYIVMTGRLRVVVEDEGEDGSEQAIGEVGRGETVGEMALLTDDPRSATVFAVRDTELARLPRDGFLRLVDRHPRFLMGLTRETVNRLRRHSRPSSAATSLATSIALVSMDPAFPLQEFVAQIAEALRAYGSVVVVGSGDIPEAIPAEGSVTSRLSRWIQEREESGRFLIYRADPTWTEWTELCTRQADRLLLVGSVKSSPAPGEIEHSLVRRWARGRAPRRTLILVRDDGAPTETLRWLADREVDEHLHVQRGSRADHARVARSLAGEAHGLVLGGGGARGLAHIGVLRALQELHIPIDFIGGTSIGAVIAAGYALNEDWQQILRLWRTGFRSLRDYTWPFVSLTKGARLNRNLRYILRDHQIEDLRLPFFALATNLTRAEQVVTRQGGLFEAVRASVSLPGIFPPCLQPSGDYHVDGGLLNNVPVDVMKRIVGNGPVIGVDVSPDAELEADPCIATEVSGWKLLARRLSPFSRRQRGPGIVGLLLRSTELGCIAVRNQTQQLADLYLRLPLETFGMLEFGAIEAIVQRGYEASLEPLTAWQEARGNSTGRVNR
jgi:predicted acylesterase/phospholipase RssA/CRP-like cAMP-binding protein